MFTKRAYATASKLIFHRDTQCSSLFPILAMGRHLYSQYKTAPVPRDLIPSLGHPKQQILWLGCSDSGYEETKTLDVLPEEMIVVRNVGNMALSNDLAWASAVQYAMENLQVNHIVVCGHYGCGIVTAEPAFGFSYPWQKKLRSSVLAHQQELDSLPTKDRNHYFVQVNVIEQMRLVAELLDLLYPDECERINIHGFVYDRSRDRAERIILSDVD